MQTNALADEKSPYLLQHAQNPVHWQAWNDETFALAQKENKPIFLSIGYATCHWCHVMAHESFEDQEVADVLNRDFIAVKVDREERPDIDQIYMTVCQMMTGSGGWPLTVVMTPDKKPFFAGTYFPKRGRFGRSGLMELLPRLAEAFHKTPDQVNQATSRIMQALQAEGHDLPTDVQPETLTDEAAMLISHRYDEVHGGFSEAPKFPSPHNLLFLMRHGIRKNKPQLLKQVFHTLREMRLGGLFDQIGFGFHRYSTDAEWLLPHFEKMLYDQAMLICAYSEAAAFCRKNADFAENSALFEQTVVETVDYVQRVMRSPEGGFYSAEDADSEGVEGKFYVWQLAELKELLTAQDFEFAAKTWHLTEMGNFADEATGRRDGNNIPHLKSMLSESEAAQLERIRQTLFTHREDRIHPLKDDKILTDWNGLMIYALARAGRLLKRPDFIELARDAVGFALTYLYSSVDGFYHRYREGDAGIRGTLNDYAWMVSGLLEMYQAHGEAESLALALKFNAEMIDQFYDGHHGGFYMTSEKANDLIVRPKEFYDGAMPSGNAMAIHNLLILNRLTGRSEFAVMANRSAASYGKALNDHPSAFAMLMTAFEDLLAEAPEFVVTNPDQTAREYLEQLRAQLHPGLLIIEKNAENDVILADLCPFTAAIPLNDQTVYYCCQNGACQTPVTDPMQLPFSR